MISENDEYVVSLRGEKENDEVSSDSRRKSIKKKNLLVNLNE